MNSPMQRSPAAESPKRRACDECRSRKLACTKEADGCARCKRDGVRCHYSPQKQMGRPRKVKPQEDTPQTHVQVEDEPTERRQPLIMPATDGAMDLDLDLDMAFFDMNDINFLDLVGSDFFPYPHQSVPEPPKHPARSPGVWQMMTTEHLAHEVNYDHNPVPDSLAEEISRQQVADIMTAEIPETISLPALSPQQSSSISSELSPSQQPSKPTTCSCLAAIYLALESLSHLPKDACSAIHVARSASKAAYNTISCPICSNPSLDPTDPTAQPPIQSLQNMMMLGALLPSLSDAYKSILRMVDEEAHAANINSRKLVFQLTSYGGLWGSLADPDNICGTTENVDGRELDPAMWRLTVRALLKVDVYGLSDCTPGHEQFGRDKSGQPLSQPGLKDIIQLMEDRSRMRHEQVDALVAAGQLRMNGSCEYVPLENHTGEKPTCLRIIDIAKRSVQSLVIP